MFLGVRRIYLKLLKSRSLKQGLMFVVILYVLFNNGNDNNAQIRKEKKEVKGCALDHVFLYFASLTSSWKNYGQQQQ